MPNPVWPAALPQNFFLQMRDKKRSGFIDFPTDQGIGKRRRIEDSAGRDLSQTLILSQVQRLIFDEFWDETLFGGTLEWDWIDPVTLLAVTYRFLEYPDFAQQPAVGAAGGKLHVGEMRVEMVGNP